jgi:predicted  nucleic acid-binding Zn-ribbon protein
MEIKKIEEKITEWEKKKAAIEEELSKVENYSNPDKLADFGLQLQKIEDQLAEWQQQWEDLMGKLE